MILQALNRYYDILVLDTEIARFGYSTVGVSFALNISAEGEILDVLPLFSQEQRGKKTVEVPRSMTVPEYAEPTSNIEASFLCGKSEYVLGISNKDSDKPGFSSARYSEFQRFNMMLLKQADTESARAVMAFLETHMPQLAREHPAILPFLGELLKGRRIVFRYFNTFVHEDPIIKCVWESYYANKGSTIGNCLVTGEASSIALKHRKISGNVGKNSFNAPLVSFNRRAFESYNRTEQQGLNSPISEKAALAYSTALNYLLSDANPNRKFYLGDSVMVYWAESSNRNYESVFASFFGPEYVKDENAAQQHERRHTESMIESVAAKVTRAKALDWKSLQKSFGDEHPRFCILALAPVGDGRLSVRFFINDVFDDIVENLMAHYRDMEIAKEFDSQQRYLSIGHILSETVSPNVKDKEATPLLAGAVSRSILTNVPYPAALYYAVINRIRADIDDKEKGIQKINYVRAAVIKAFLIRKYRHQPPNPLQEVLSVALNEQSTIPAYLLGRLFAVLEKVQQEAIKNVNASIKDRYFTTACANPRSVFPTLLRLSQHHISKAEYGYAADRRIQDILNLLDVEQNPIPARLTLDEQGVFVLGYYHQRAAFYTKNTEPVATSV
jgi:CRISPR-associated protein Csd1